MILIALFIGVVAGLCEEHDVTGYTKPISIGADSKLYHISADSFHLRYYAEKKWW